MTALKLNYDPEVARAKLAEYTADLERQTIIADAFHEAYEREEAEQHRLERQVRSLTDRMRGDGLLPPEVHEVFVSGRTAHCATCHAWVGRVTCLSDEDAAAWAESHRKQMAGLSA